MRYQDFYNQDRDNEENVNPEENLLEAYQEEVEDLSDELMEMDEIFEDTVGPINIRVRVKSARIRCFSGPGLNFDEVQIAKKGDEFVISGEVTLRDSLEWGHVVENYSLWIPLNYCETVGTE